MRRIAGITSPSSSVNGMKPVQSNRIEGLLDDDVPLNLHQTKPMQFSTTNSQLGMNTRVIAVVFDKARLVES